VGFKGEAETGAARGGDGGTATGKKKKMKRREGERGER
jgi:hypothetical protein